MHSAENEGSPCRAGPPTTSRTSMPPDRRFAERVRAFDVPAPRTPAGLTDFEPVYFNTLVVALDHYFSDPTDGPEDSPLSEVRALSAAIMSDDSDRPITSIEFSQLSKAFF